jgi:cell division protein FtsI (penicillin-binding protein 3)
LLLVLIAALLALAGRCFYLQFLKHSYYDSISAKQQLRREPQKPQRGTILDCRGRMLAASNKVQTIFAEPRVITDPENISARLAPIVELSNAEICQAIRESKNPGFAKIKEGVDFDQCRLASAIYGIGIQTDWQRYYPTGTLASHIVGFISADGKGLAGVELRYNKELTGSASQNIFLADGAPNRRPIRLQQQNGFLKDGMGVILTIDATIQQFVRSALMKQYKSYEAESAVAIVAEPKSGAILAMVSLPDFDPNNISSEDPNDLRNRAITDQFEPGRMIKPIIAAIALEEGAVSPNEKIFCEYGNYHGKGFGQIGEYEGHRFGELTVREILVNSSNIGMAKIGQKLGRDKLHNGLKLFGFGKKTGIDLPGEADGLVWPVKNWTGYSVTRIPFGQEISVTTIQMVQAFCVLANGGHLVHPYVVKAVVDNDGKITRLNHPRQVNVGFVIKPEVAKWFTTDALTGVVNEGTGKKAKLEKWQVFGKTGTANVARSDQKGYDEESYIASFIGGAPAEDPEIMVLVSVRKPNKRLGKGYTGGIISAPVAAEIIEKTLTYLEKDKQ